MLRAVALLAAVAAASAFSVAPVLSCSLIYVPHLACGCCHFFCAFFRFELGTGLLATRGLGRVTDHVCNSGKPRRVAVIRVHLVDTSLRTTGRNVDGFEKGAWRRLGEFGARPNHL